MLRPADQDTGTAEIPREPGSKLYQLEVGDSQQTRIVTVANGCSLVFGTDPANDVVLRDNTVSGKHCRVTCKDGRLKVEDLRSKNGLFVGGARVNTAELQLGGLFVVGRVTVRIADRHEERCEGPDVATIPGLVGRSTAMRRLAQDVARLAQLKLPVLVHGATGTGKELVARAMHTLGPRADKPFVAINAGAIPKELAAAELFGHERGAYTGAHAKRNGAFLEANRGTLFLDEVGELPYDVQVKLLRVLEQHEVRPLGSDATIPVDVRIVAATWAPLSRLVGEGKFREDLYHRIAVTTVRVPSLDERRSDIAELARHFLAQRASDVGAKELTPAAIATLVSQRWPGTVRQLRNAVLRAAVMSSTDAITSNDVSRALQTEPSAMGRLPHASAVALFAACEGNIARSARTCGVARSTFRAWLKANAEDEASDQAPEAEAASGNGDRQNVPPKESP